MASWWCLVALLSGAALAERHAEIARPEIVSFEAVRVEIVTGGQFYHRPGHLVVDEPHAVSLDAARKDGYAPCPECGAEAYFKALLSSRRMGTVYEGVPARKSAVAAGPLDPIPAGSPAPAAAIPTRPAPYDIPADGIAVPGTGGLLKVPTFKGSGGIIAIPYPMGGYGIIEPPYPAAPAAPPAGDPAPSGR